MATTQKTTAKTTAAKPAAAKKSTATKATAKKTTAKKTTAAKRTSAARKSPAKKITVVTQPTVASTSNASTTNAVRETIASATKGADDTVKQYAAVATDQLVELRQLAREVVDMYVGIPFLLGSRFADSATTPTVDVDSLKSLVEDVRARLTEMPSVDFDAVKSFIDEAKAVGHARTTAFEYQAAAAADTVSKRVAQLRNRYAA
jgi:hypothetical protein